MPYAFELHRVRLPSDFDRRRKLSIEDRLVIKKVYKMGTPITQIAKDFSVNRKTIQAILFPEQVKKYAYKIPYDPEKNRIAVQKTRLYKRQLALEGRLSKKVKTQKGGKWKDY